METELVHISMKISAFLCSLQAAYQQDPVQGPLLHVTRPRQERESFHFTFVVYFPPSCLFLQTFLFTYRAFYSVFLPFLPSKQSIPTFSLPSKKYHI